MKILIIGLGSIGRRHLDILQRKYDHELYALRSGNGLEPTPAGVTEIKGWHDIGAMPDIALITNLTPLHIYTATKCAERGINLFIEKPIDVSSYKIDRLIQIVKEKNLAAYVAYPFRFHKGLYDLKMGQAYMRLRGRQFIEDAEIVCKTNYEKWQSYKVGEHRRKHNGVLLELSHEIDIAQWFFGTISGIRGYFGDTTADLMLKCAEVDKEIRIKLDMVSKVEERYVLIDGEIFNYAANDLMYEHQMDYYLDNFVRPSSLINNLVDASDMFYRLIQFRDNIGRGNGEYTFNDMRP